MASAKLPVELIEDEILPKLPAKSLIRFKSVWKQFNALISSPKFTKLHLINSLSSDANRLVIINHGGPHFIDLENLRNPPSPVRVLTPASFKPHPINPIAGSCNGLLLFRNVSGSEYLLFNPFTGLYSVYVAPELLFGIGYDPYVDDYKILAINSESAGSMLVYSVTNGLWRSVYINNSEERETVLACITSSDLPVVLNGCLFHWLIWWPELSKHRIVYFDICTENWTLDVPVPSYNCEKDKRQNLMELRVFEGCLCVLSESMVRNSLDMWVMKEYGDIGSWVKLFRVPNRNYAPLAYVRGSSSKVLLLGNFGKLKQQLILYDIQDGTSEKVSIHFVPRRRSFYQVCLFKGSLLNLPVRQD